MAKRKTLAEIVDRHVADIERVSADAEIARVRAERDLYRSRYKAALAQIEAEKVRADAIVGLNGIGRKKPARTRQRGGKHRATAIVMLSDWHVEERVDGDTVNWLNEFDLSVCERRIAELTSRFIQLLEHERRFTNISRVVVWMGGDFLSGHIHEDTAEMAQLAPLAAVRWAGERLGGFVDVVSRLADSVVIATNSGNHGRSTHKLRVGTEMEHSFEQHLYLTMAAAERSANVEWKVGGGYLNYVDLDGFRVRFHHGHAYQYAGGIGGIHVPVSKANAAWNAVEPANLTCFGHWHQFSWLRAGRYVSNGSLIGHSAYATRIKASFEPPCQAMVIVDHHRNEVVKAFPIFCDSDLRERRCSSTTSTFNKQNFVPENSAARTLERLEPSPQMCCGSSSSSNTSARILHKCKNTSRNPTRKSERQSRLATQRKISKAAAKAPR